MDHVSARIECLKLATQFFTTFPPGFQPREMHKPEEVLATAQKWADFAIGPKVIESSSQRPKGADEK